MTKELLFSVTKKDVEIQTFRVGGKGGQKRDKTSSGVRIVHKASGATGESRESRSQTENKKTAFKRMAETKKFQSWAKLKANKIVGVEAQIKDNVEKSMQNKNLKIEGRKENKWVDLENQ